MKRGEYGTSEHGSPGPVTLTQPPPSNSLLTSYMLCSSKTVSSGAGSYLVFHYTPSPLALDFNLTTVKFEPCDQRWGDLVPHMNDGRIDRNTAPTCLYNFNRFAKVRPSEVPFLLATLQSAKLLFNLRAGKKNG